MQPANPLCLKAVGDAHGVWNPVDYTKAKDWAAGDMVLLLDFPLQEPRFPGAALKVRERRSPPVLSDYTVPTRLHLL